MCIRDRIEAAAKTTHVAFDKTGTPVSYTHLDVYKRQGAGLVRPVGKAEKIADRLQRETKVAGVADERQPLHRGPVVKPVSYTHLDVYKRQSVFVQSVDNDDHVFSRPICSSRRNITLLRVRKLCGESRSSPVRAYSG